MVVPAQRELLNIVLIHYITEYLLQKKNKPLRNDLTFTIDRCTYQVETIILLTYPGCFILGRYAWKTCSHLFLELIVFINPMTFSVWRGWHTKTHPKTDLVRSAVTIGMNVWLIVLINAFSIIIRCIFKW